jgi:hypothetical protein
MKMAETPDRRSNEGLNNPLSPDALLAEQEYPDMELDAEIAAFSVLESMQS